MDQGIERLYLPEYQKVCRQLDSWRHGPIQVDPLGWEYASFDKHDHLPQVDTEFEGDRSVEITDSRRYHLPILAFTIGLTNCESLRELNHSKGYARLKTLSVGNCPNFQFPKGLKLERLSTDILPPPTQEVQAWKAYLTLEDKTVLWNTKLIADKYELRIGSRHPYLQRQVQSVDRAGWSQLQAKDAIWRATPEESLKHFDGELLLTAIRDLEPLLTPKRKKNAIMIIQAVLRQKLQNPACSKPPQSL